MNEWYKVIIHSLLKYFLALMIIPTPSNFSVNDRMKFVLFDSYQFIYSRAHLVGTVSFYYTMFSMIDSLELFERRKIEKLTSTKCSDLLNNQLR